MAASSDLIALLEREAAAERERVLNEASAQAESIRTDARREAEAYVAAARERLEAESRAGLVKAQSTAQLRASSLVLQAKEDEIARIFAGAQAELAAFARDGQRYPAALHAFIEEGLRGLPGRAVVMVNPADQAITETLIRTRGRDVAVQADPAVEAGARILSPDGRFVVVNTLGSRLERAKPALAAELAKLLWE